MREIMMTMAYFSGSVCLLIALMTLAQSQPVAVGQLAFPGAEGFGAFSVGGRGGKVIKVSNLEDAGEGSLREAVEAKGRRIILFSVSGIIELRSPLLVSEPYMTLAGQSAPGDGVCIKGYGLVISNTHDIIVRYMRFRPGDESRTEQDAITVSSSADVIIDHCSASWGTDEVVSVVGKGATRVTVQWTMITESLNNSIHHKGPHGYASLVRVDGDVTFHHNVFAHHSSRIPRPGCYGNMDRGGMLDFRNNLIYNWGQRSGYNDTDKVSMNYVGNYLKAGPSTSRSMRHIAFQVNSPTLSMYMDGNNAEGTSETDWQLVKFADNSWQRSVRLPVPLQHSPVKTETALEAMKSMLDNAGAIHPKRDLVDQRIIKEVREGRGRIIDSQRDVDGWPVYQASVALRDSDDDGMPDDWENSFQLDPLSQADANSDEDGDGYTNIEEFLNFSHPRVRD